MTVTAADRAVRPARRLPGEAGSWIFILGDMTVFAVFFLTYLHSRSQKPGLFRHSQATLDRNLGAINTVLLLVSSLCVVLAIRAVRSCRHDLAGYLFMAAFGCGLGFIAIKAIEYHEKIAHGVNPATNEFYMYYFILTGIHLFHLVVGMVVLAVLHRLSQKPELTKNQVAFLEGGACFWHMVDLLWLVLFPLIFLVR
jgi:nitric oxide reductase NorE protein